MLGGADDDVDDVGETAAAAATFFHGVIDFCRDDQLPTVVIEESGDRLFDVFDRNEIAAANQHRVLPDLRNLLNCPDKAKQDIVCQDRNGALRPEPNLDRF